MVSGLGAALLLLTAAGCAGTSKSASVTAPPAPAEPPMDLPPPTPSADNGPATIEPIGSSSEAAASAGGLSLREDAPLHYVVKRGDSLWVISGHFLRDPWQWPQLWYANPQISNPHLIYPGERLSLVRINGRTRLALENTQRLAPRLREESLEQAVPAIPIDAIREFLRGPRVVSKAQIDGAPYVVAFTDEHVVGGEANGIFVKNVAEGANSGWSVMRIGQKYVDPDTGEGLGFEAIPDGEAELRKPGQPATMMLTASSQEILVGDRLFPLEQENFQSDFYPHPPTAKVEGRIISVFGGVGEIAQYQIVALNRGSRDHLDPGTTLGIFQVRGSVADPYSDRRVNLPDVPAGIAMVFKVTDRVSYALVMTNYRAVHVLDKVGSPASAGTS